MQPILHTDLGTWVAESWHKRRADGKQRRGRVRTYGVGEAMLHKFRPVDESGAKVLPLLPNTNTQQEPIYYVPLLLSEPPSARSDESYLPASTQYPTQQNLRPELG
jgi:hypothetical protein